MIIFCTIFLNDTYSLRCNCMVDNTNLKKKPKTYSSIKLFYWISIRKTWKCFTDPLCSEADSYSESSNVEYGEATWPAVSPSLWQNIDIYSYVMMTSTNGNIFRVTAHLCGEFTSPRWIPPQRPVTRSFDAFFDLHLNKRLSEQSWGWWFETLSCPLWCHCNVPSSIMAAGL